MAKQNYYASRKSQLLKDFDKTASLVKDSVVSSYESDFADTLYREARQEYEALIPQIPHLEGVRGGPLNSFLRITAQELAVYKAMKKHGKTAGEAWEICHEALRLRMKQFPRIKRWLFGRIMYSSFLCCQSAPLPHKTAYYMHLTNHIKRWIVQWVTCWLLV